LRALGHPRLHLVEVELEAALIVLRQQRVEVTETLDEAAIAREARVGGDDVVDRALLGACAREADNDCHLILLIRMLGEWWWLFLLAGEAAETRQRRLAGKPREPRHIWQAGTQASRKILR